MNRKTLFIIYFVLVGVFMVVIASVAIKRIEESKSTKRKVILEMETPNGMMPNEGQLLIIKRCGEDTVIVQPASDDDARAFLENHGKG